MTDLLDCGHKPSEHGPHTTGYGVDANDKRHCYDCCAKIERAHMIETGRATLYLTTRQNPLISGNTSWVQDIVTDWAGCLVFPCAYVSKGRHNFAGSRYDTSFNGPDGHVWHAVQYGENTQIAHCRRTRETWQKAAS